MGRNAVLSRTKNVLITRNKSAMQMFFVYILERKISVAFDDVEDSTVSVNV